MLVIGLLLTLAMLLVGRNLSDPADMFVCLLTGLIFSPLVWGIYRVGRFVLIR